MKDMILSVGEHSPRWMYVLRSDENYVYGHVWAPIARRWSRTIVWYPISTIDKGRPACPRPVGMPLPTDRRNDGDKGRSLE